MKANKMPSAKKMSDATRRSKAKRNEGKAAKIKNKKEKMKFVWAYSALDMPFLLSLFHRD